MSHRYTDLLVAQFATFLEAYDRYCPFTKHGQLQYHAETIQRIRSLGSVEVALNDVLYQRSLYRTLQAWGIGTRGSVLRPFPAFVTALQEKAQEILSFQGLAIDEPGLHVSDIAESLACLIQALDIVENKNKVVAGSKTLHHLLPDLVVPIDREYTQRFFGWQNPRFQDFPEECFVEAFHAFVGVARDTHPVRFVGRGWYTSRTKVIDNAVVGMWCWVAHKRKTEA